MDNPNSSTFRDNQQDPLSKTRCAAHGEIRANHINLARFAQTVLQPFAIAGHYLVDAIDGYLKDQNAKVLLASCDRSSDKSRRRVERRAVGFEVDKMNLSL